MAVVQRATSVLDTMPRTRAAVRPQISRPAPAPSRRHVRVREPQLGMLLRRALVAAIPAVCILATVYGRMQLLEASVRRSHLNVSIRQELSKQHVLRSSLLNSTRPEQIDQFARDNQMVMQVTPPIFVGGHQKGR